MGRMVRRVGVLAGFVFLTVLGSALAQNTTTRVSVSTAGAEANDASSGTAISGDGRYIAFESAATNLVPGDTNGLSDIFVRDRQTGVTERVSVADNEAQATGGTSRAPSLSADGRFVAFTSSATNLVPGDTNGAADVFVRDRALQTTTRVSVITGGGQAALASFDGVISANGRYVAFASDAANLIPGDTNATTDIFRHDLETRVTTRISVGPALSNGAFVQANGESRNARISADGQVVTFASSATNLVTGDTNGAFDVFARDLGSGTTARISVGTGGSQSNGANDFGSISSDGRFVAFDTTATNLVTNGAPGIYVHDRTSGVTSAVSVHPNQLSAPSFPSISPDGRFICNVQLVEGVSGFGAVLVDRLTLNKTRVNIATSGVSGDGFSDQCALNTDATILAFRSSSTNLIAGDTNGKPDIYVRTNVATMALEKTALTFGAVTSGGAFVWQTSRQIVQLAQSGVGTVTWTAASSQPWLQVSPASGAGSGTLSIAVAPAAGLPASGTVTGTIFVSLTGSMNTLPPITVTLTLTPAGTHLGAFGSVDTPPDNRTGVTGAVPFTGWALDDVEVTRVSICRAAFGAEIAPVDPNCGGAAEIFVGFGVFIEGARPDVAAAFPTYPLSTRAGWGFMVLTNFLPNQGNGTFRFMMRAEDRDGHWVLLGTRTITCANASATLPFGTIDTPVQGDPRVSGVSYVNFGWALTPQPKTIPIDGSTIRVIVDGQDIGTVDYGHPRPDLQSLFPGFNNTNGAVGFRILDTTLLTNGLHTISWIAADNQGAIEGLGSRFFTVSNGVGAVTAAATAASTSASRWQIDALPLEATPLVGRRGWDLEGPVAAFPPGASGVTVIRSEEVSRVELQLGDGEHTGYLRTAAGLAPLPIGSRLDPASNTFMWAPGVGFVGRYDFVFVRSTNGRPLSRRDVRIVLHPKGRGLVGPQVVIDAPRANTAVSEPFMVGGWAVDLDAAEGTGVTTLHAWAFPAAGGAPIFLGATAYGGTRPDVAAVHGDRFKDSGFGLIVQGLPAGDYDLALFAWSTETMTFVAPAVVRVHVTP